MSLKSFGVFVKQQREQLGYRTRLQFENEFHFGNGTLNNIEGGYSRTSNVMLKRLADIFGVNPGLLMDLMFDAINLDEADRLAALMKNALTTNSSQSEQWIKLPAELKPDDIEEIKEFVQFKSQRRLKQSALDEKGTSH